MESIWEEQQKLFGILHPTNPATTAKYTMQSTGYCPQAPLHPERVYAEEPGSVMQCPPLAHRLSKADD